MRMASARPAPKAIPCAWSCRPIVTPANKQIVPMRSSTSFSRAMWMKGCTRPRPSAMTRCRRKARATPCRTPSPSAPVRSACAGSSAVLRTAIWTNAIRSRPGNCRHASTPGRKRDGEAAPGLDGFAEQAVARCLFGALRERLVAMGDLVGTKISDGGFQLFVAVAKLCDLPGIVLVDHFLARGRAGHRRLFTHQCGRRAQRESGDTPHRLQRRRTRAALDDQPVEGFEMTLFFCRHAADCFARRFVAKHRELAFIDAHRAIFAGMIDTNHRRDIVAGRRTGC